MSEIGQIAQSILPALLVCGVIIILINKFFQQEKARRDAELRKNIASQSLPMRLQAYERIVLFLERMVPENMLFRVHKTGMSAKLFQSELLQILRSEFEHNLTQQLYLSPQAWEMVKRSKEEMTKIIILASNKIGPQATGLDLTREVLTIYSSLDKNPIQITLEVLKKEVKQYLL